MKKKKKKKRKKKSEGQIFGMDKADLSKKPCQAKGHSIRGWLRLRDAVLSRIVQELSLLSLEARRKVLQQSFSQAQRVALEQWMLRHRTRQKTSLQRCARCHKDKARATKRPWGAPKAKSAAGLLKIKGVVSTRSSGQSSYYAVACLGMLRFTSRKTRDLWTAVGYHEDLIRLLQRVRSWTGSLEERLLCAVTEALPSMKAMDLHLAVRFRLQRWVAQPLSSPTFVATNQVSLRRGLHAWRRLHTAREALRAAERAGPPSLSEERSWQFLRSTFLDVEVEAGMSRQLREDRLAQAEQSRAAHRQRLLERWNRQRMAEEDHCAQVERKRERAFFARGSRLLSKLEQAEQGLCKAQAAQGAPEPDCKRRRVGSNPLAAGRRCGTVRDPSATLELWRSG